MTLRIARVGPEHAALVRELMLRAFEEYQDKLNPPSGAHSETLERVRSVIADGGAFLAFHNELPVGSARYSYRPDRVYVERVGVLPSHRGLGIATQLMEVTEIWARDRGYRQVEVGVRLSLDRNLALYRLSGYSVIQVEPHPKGPDWILTLFKRLEDRQARTKSGGG